VLEGRRVLLAVTGGVAAYKSAILARRLIEAGAQVRVILSESAIEFVGAQTFAAITGQQPVTSLFGQDSVSPHTELARWCEMVVVAPATAATIGKLASGISSDLVPATLLATEAPVLLAPAMHTEMWNQPATQRNVDQLAKDGYYFVGPTFGPLAGGDVGMGRLVEPESIVEAVRSILTPNPDAISILVTAGGTREPIDPVRYIGNRSSGKMGHAIADAAALRGYNVTLVTTSEVPALPSVRVIACETAQQMADAVNELQVDVAVMAAAVADFQPEVAHESKLSRGDGNATVALKPTPDILASVVARENPPYVVGFAAETGGLERAIEKARSKKVDLLLYNDVTEVGSGFGTDTNRVTLIDANGTTDELPMMSKRDVASVLIDRIVADLEGKD
jgi:phosphopantothenoylcysteine decarboxylase/phosphopantothenate--cysteine ligase